jgi:DNA-binding beta-propeller fold protein YncE
VANCYRVGVAIAPDDTKAYIVHQASTNALLVDTTTNVIVFFAVGGYHNKIAISSDGGRIYLADSAYTSIDAPSVSVPVSLRATLRLQLAHRSLDRVTFNFDT